MELALANVKFINFMYYVLCILYPNEQYKTQFFTLMGRVHDAIDKAREEEEAQEQAKLKVSKVPYWLRSGGAPTIVSKLL